MSFVWYHPRRNKLEVFWFNNQSTGYDVLWVSSCIKDGWIYIGELE